MECEKCNSNNIIVKEAHKSCEFDEYNGEYYEINVFVLKCNCCGYEFTEVM